MKVKLSTLKRGQTFYGAGIQWLLLSHTNGGKESHGVSHVISTDIVEHLAFDTEATGGEKPFERVGWIIIGAMTGPGRREHQPKREWIEAIVNKAREAGTAVFMKDSLKPIWGDDILQGYPPGFMAGDNKGGTSI